MADVISPDQISFPLVDILGIVGSRETDSEFNELYERSFHILEELEDGSLFEDDLELAESILQEVADYVITLRNDAKISERYDRKTKFGNENLKYARTQMNKMKQALEEAIAKFKGEERPSVRTVDNPKQSEAIMAQISALKEMKAQIEAQITALSRVI